MSDNYNRLAGMIWGEPDDYSEMEEGRRIIEKIFLKAPELLVEGRTFGDVRQELESLLPPYRSLNLELIPEEEPFHCSPDERRVKKGEIVTLDCSLRLNRLWADRAVSLAVGRVDESRRVLLHAARKAFLLVKEASTGGVPFVSVSNRLERFLEGTPCSLVPDCGGHGIGMSLHQDSDYIYSRPDKDLLIPEWGAFTVEPVISLGVGGKKLYAYFEDTIIQS